MNLMVSIVCEKFDSSDEIRQGTIIKFIDKNLDDSYGIIVTGNCDIAQDKYGNFLSWCPIYSFEYYIDNFFIQTQCRKKVDRLKNSLKKELSTFFKVEQFNDNALDNFIARTEDDLKKTISSNELVKKIIETRPFFHINKFDKSHFEALKLKFDGFSTLPGDKFFIDAIPDPSKEFENKNGFIVDLRRIKEIKIDSISKFYYYGTTECVALAKLIAPYCQKMVQQLGSMFSDIGLPSEYEVKFKESKKYFVNGVKQ